MERGWGKGADESRLMGAETIQIAGPYGSMQRVWPTVLSLIKKREAEEGWPGG
jgi:hypothetical protein